MACLCGRAGPRALARAAVGGAARINGRADRGGRGRFAGECVQLSGCLHGGRSGEGTLGKLINDDSLYTSTQSTMKKADRALDGLDDSGPITAVGIVAKSLF